MSFELRVHSHRIDVVQGRSGDVVCEIHVASSIIGNAPPTHRIAPSPDGRWLALLALWDSAGLVFVVESIARRAIVRDALVTVDRSIDPPAQWTSDATLRVWTRREDTGAPCWFEFDPDSARWINFDDGDRSPPTPRTIALASAHREPLARRAALLDATPPEAFAEARAVLDRREARELLLSADARRDLRRARELLAAAIALAPDWSAPRAALAAALDDAGQWEAMLEVTALWREAVGSDPRALVEHAAALLRLGRITECVETLDAAEREHGDLRALMDNEAFDRCSDLPALSRWA